MGDGRQYRPAIQFFCYFYCVIKRPLKRCELFFNYITQSQH